MYYDSTNALNFAEKTLTVATSESSSISPTLIGVEAIVTQLHLHFILPL